MGGVTPFKLRRIDGPAVREPTEAVFMDQGGDPIPTRDDLESAYLLEDGDGLLAFASEAQKQIVAWREGYRQPR